MAKQEKEDKGLSPTEIRELLIRLVRSIHLINNSVYFNDQKFRAMVMREVRTVVARAAKRYPEIAEPIDRTFK